MSMFEKWLMLLFAPDAGGSDGGTDGGTDGGASAGSSDGDGEGSSAGGNAGNDDNDAGGDDSADKDGGSEGGARVPVSALTKERERRQQAERELNEIRKTQMSEKERAEAERGEAQAERDAEKARADALEKQLADGARDRLILAAASKAKFVDPDDAIGRLQRDGKLDDIKTAADAKAAVEKIAAKNPHYLKAEGNESGLRRVLNNGQAEGDQGSEGDKPVIPAEEFNGYSADQLVALQESDPEMYGRSLLAAARSTQ